MSRVGVTIKTRDGICPASVFSPNEIAGPWPAVIFFMDGLGIRPVMWEMGQQIADRGYFVLLPDLYYRLGYLRFDMTRRAEGRMQAIFAAMNSLTNQLVVDDTAAFIGWLDAQERVAPGPLGCVGYCMSGKFVTTVAARFANRFAGSASLYGVGIVTKEEDSPHRLVPKIKGEIYYGFAETDPHVAEGTIPTLSDALKTAKTKHVLEILPGTQHGYQFPEREVYDTDAAEGSWTKIFDMWARTLKGK